MRETVFVSCDVDTSSIQKCLVDFDCQFIRIIKSDSHSKHLNEHVTKTQDKRRYFILYKNYFAIHSGGHLLRKCSYDCRNRVMSFPRLYLTVRSQVYRQAFEDNNYGLDLIDGILHNNELPHLIFTNESIWKSEFDLNTIMEKYTTVDLQRFAEITKSKPCNQNFFLVRLDASLTHPYKGPFMCCNMKNLETYEYSFEARSRVEKLLFENTDACFAKWKAEEEALKAKLPAARNPEFRLLDIDGRPAEENTDYYIGLYDHPDTILRIDRFSKLYVSILTPYRLKSANKMVVQYTVINGIHYLTHENRIFRAYAQNIRLTDVAPTRDQRLEFHVTENNTVKIVQWNKHIWLTFTKKTVSNSSVEFDQREEIMLHGTPLELFLKRV